MGLDKYERSYYFAAMTPATARASTKGEETRALILSAAVEQASEGGFESLTIGSLAERTGLSKSGLFAHFGSRLELQMAALDEAARRFTEQVFLPSFRAPRGLKRLEALLDAWFEWPRRAKLPGGCPIDAATREYDHRPGPMREAVLDRQRTLERELAKTVRLAIDTGELAADTDPDEVAFALMGLILAYYRAQATMGDEAAEKRARAGFARLIDQHRTR